jgi:hypothetical protein
MKVLIMDFLYPEGHRGFNESIIKYFSEFSKVSVLSQKKYYREFEDELSIDIAEQNDFEVKNGRFLSRLCSMNIMKKSACFCENKEWDYLWVLSFDTITFALGIFFFRNLNNIFLMHHNNVDELTNCIKLKFFRSYMNKVNHIVLEEFIRDYLVNEIGVDDDRVYVLPHPLNKNKNIGKEKYLCVGLSNSNDEKLIEEIIIKERETNYFLKLKKKVILKSKVDEYDNGYLKVIKGYIEKEKYDDYVSNCHYIFMPFSNSYCYRMSGTLMDSLSNNKIVLGSDIPLVRYYAAKFPSICKIVRNIDELYAVLNSLDLNSKVREEFLSFLKIHSKENIVKSLKLILEEH